MRSLDPHATDSIDQALAYRLTRAARLLRTDLTHLLAPFELAPEHFYLLFRLHERDGRAQGELVDPVLDDRANVSRLVRALERDGLAERRPDPADGRVRLVHITAAGRDRLGAVLEIIPKERARLFGDLTPTQFEALDQALRLVEARASRA